MKLVASIIRLIGIIIAVQYGLPVMALYLIVTAIIAWRKG